ncbi:hypothetical protein ACI2K4_27770 [Micromonospora sp. NPDC050397]|uniref:hypothetical protein n=1 Tax=Micromonospora sp. NPDC050397 TaxID=3364279 RepID=UPI003850A48D
MFVAGVWMLAVHPDDWGGRWAGLAAYLRVSLLVLCALMVAAGAWQVGRERRRGMGELLGSVPRPGWQPLLVAWVAVSLAGTLGLLVAFAAAAVLVGRIATYAGGGWWWTLAVGVLALWTATAFGVLVGRLVPLRAAAPVAGLATYVGLAVVTYFEQTGVAWLSPLYTGWSTYLLVPGVLHLWQALWLLALTGALLALAARLRRAALLAGVIAVAAAAPIVFGAGPRLRNLPPDPAATRAVCTTDGPQVCVARINGFLLDDAAAVIQPVLRRIEGIPGAPVRASDYAMKAPEQSYDPADGTLWLNLDFQATATGGLSNVDHLRGDARQVIYEQCDVRDQQVYASRDLALAWLLDDKPFYDVPVDRLRALPPDRQRAWFGAFLDVSRRCDAAGMTRLLGEL